MNKVAQWYKELEDADGDHMDYGKFEDIADPPSKRRDLCAFLLLDELLPGRWDIVAAAEHDQIWLDIDVDDLSEVASKEDILYLLRCGVWYDDDTDSLSMWA